MAHEQTGVSTVNVEYPAARRTNYGDAPVERDMPDWHGYEMLRWWVQRSVLVGKKSRPAPVIYSVELMVYSTGTERIAFGRMDHSRV